MALPVMLAVIATGVIITDRMVDTSYGALVATALWLAARRQDRPARHRARDRRARPLQLAARSPRPPAAGDAGSAQDRWTELSKWVSFEFVLALGIVLLATIVANTVPAKHAIIQDWPYSFRFSSPPPGATQRS